MTPPARSKQPNQGVKKSSGVTHTVCLSKSLEKSFLALKRPGAKEAYVEAELVNGLAHQIRILREQRGWTQKELAKRLSTTQNTISRLEDPSYGRYTFRTLLGLSKAFDVALFVRYLPFSKFMAETWGTRPENFEAASYDEEASLIQFFSEEKRNGEQPQLYENMRTEKPALIQFLDSMPRERLVTHKDITVRGETICLIT